MAARQTHRVRVSAFTNPGIAQGIPAVTSETRDPFQEALDTFKSKLTAADRRNFSIASRQQLEEALDKIQSDQHTGRKLKNMNRLSAFLEGMETFGKVINVYCQASEIVAFLWGPVKLVLLVAKSLSDVFQMLLDIYEELGKTLKLYAQGECLFPKDTNMADLLADAYKVVLEFHYCTLRYFRKPWWSKIFSATWSTYKTRFSGFISSIHLHRECFIGQIQLSEFQRRREEENDHAIQAEFERNRRLRKELHQWIQPTDMTLYHRDHVQARADYPGTGQWLFNTDEMKMWLHEDDDKTQPLLWVSGLPGVGKSVLASHVIKKVKDDKRKPVVLSFYFKEETSKRDDFSSICRSFLGQLLEQAPDLVDYVYEKYRGLTSLAPTLLDDDLLEEMLEVCIKNCHLVFIVIDGVDECRKESRRKLCENFLSIVESSDPPHDIQTRCLFVSQEDRIQLNALAGVPRFKIMQGDNRGDIIEFCNVWSAKIQEKFRGLSNRAKINLAYKISESSGGSFLLAKLVAQNLFEQRTFEDLQAELEPHAFPTTINDAYERIMERLRRETSLEQSEPLKQHCIELFTWLIFAKRPLKWREIQAAKSIDVDNQAVDYEGRRLLDRARDICGAFVDEQPDGTVGFIHLTVKFFLLDKGYVRRAGGELGFAWKCITYLSMRGLCLPPQEARLPNDILQGYYGFMEYSALYWARHLETGLLLAKDDPEKPDVVSELGQELEVFLDLHCRDVDTFVVVSKRNNDRIAAFSTQLYFETLGKALVSSRKQLKHLDEVNDSEVVLDVFEVVLEVRKELEKLWISSDATVKNQLRGRYGDSLFKCPRPSCESFTTGFASADLRDAHFKKHTREFRCTMEGCSQATFGFPTVRELERHMESTHAGLEMQFPNDEELYRRPEPPRQVDQEPQNLPMVKEVQPQEVQMEEPAHETVTEKARERSPDSPERDLIVARGQRFKRRKTEHKCPISGCKKVFIRHFNLKSHMHSHSAERPWKCQVCDLGFARESDCRRHVKGHGDALYRCGGFTADAVAWGCGKAFARQDTLTNHHKSRAGSKCLAERDGEAGFSEATGDPMDMDILE